MDYAVRLASPEPLPDDPRSWCPQSWQSWLPEGPLQAVYFGSEFCQDLLPSLGEVETFCALAADAGLEAVLLTPLLRADGLGRLRKLLSGLDKQGLEPTMVFNDFGALQLLRDTSPQLRRQAGRLLNRALRDPRLTDRSVKREDNQSGRGSEIRNLLKRCGVVGLETDPDLEGSYLGPAGSGLQRVLHLPYVFTASGRNCLQKAELQEESHNFAKWLSRPCPAPCRQSWQEEPRDDLDFPLWRAGNTLFYKVPRDVVTAHLPLADRIVVHRRPMP